MQLNISNPYLRLMRFDRPAPIFLLLWPTLFALLWATSAHPDLVPSIILLFGAIFMRAAGCIISDIFDRNFDGHVERTKKRPLVTKEVSLKQAYYCVLCLLLASCSLLLFVGMKGFWIACIACMLIILYPLTKRVTFWPQAVLGTVWNLGIFIAFVISDQQITKETWMIYIAFIFWTIAFDTYYALVDRKYDIQIGVKSTAVYFGKHSRLLCLTTQLIALACFTCAGLFAKKNMLYFVALALVFCHALYHFRMTRHQDDAAHTSAFNDQLSGILLCSGVFLSEHLML